MKLKRNKRREIDLDLIFLEHEYLELTRNKDWQVNIIRTLFESFLLLQNKFDEKNRPNGSTAKLVQKLVLIRKDYDLNQKTEKELPLGALIREIREIRVQNKSR